MLHLYHCVSARSFRPLWMLDELGVPYELHMLPFPPRVLAKQYLAQNPLGTVPLLVDGDTRLTESAAMCQYLADRHALGKLAIRADQPAYGAYLNWLHMSDATLTFPQTLVLRYTHFEPELRCQPQVVADYSKWFLSRLRAVEARVLEQDYLCENRFTAADVAVGYAFMLAKHLELDSNFSAPLQAYWQRLRERPAFLRALRIEQSAAIVQGVDPTPAPALRLAKS